MEGWTLPARLGELNRARRPLAPPPLGAEPQPPSIGREEGCGATSIRKWAKRNSLHGGGEETQGVVFVADADWHYHCCSDDSRFNRII
jgi:hypothetical protein